MSVELCILQRDHNSGRDRTVLFTIMQDDVIIASAEIWYVQNPIPTLDKSFVKPIARRHGLYRRLLEERLRWLQENTTAKHVEVYVEKNSTILAVLKLNGFKFKEEEDPDEEYRWMIKQLVI